MAYTEEDLFNMSDEDLEAAVREAAANDNSPDIEIENVDTMEHPEDGQDSLEEDSEEITSDNEDDVDNEEGEDDEPDSDSDSNSDDEGTEEDEENSEEDENTSDEKEREKKDKPDVKAKVYKFKANGKEFEFTEDEIVAQFGKVFGQAMNYTQKMQALAPYRKMISAFEEEQITEDDMNLMIDALKGNKDAIAAIVKKADVDVLELDIDKGEQYTPNRYGKDDAELQIKEVIDEISNDREFAITQHVISNEWDDSSRDIFAKEPQLIKELHIDVLNGTFDKVSPLAMKLKVLDGARKPDIEYYVEAGKQYHASRRTAELNKFAEETKTSVDTERIKKVEANEKQRESVKKNAKKRKAAAPSKSRSGQKTAIDYLEDSDEAFEEWYKKLEESM